jgi:hypothetical protein
MFGAYVHCNHNKEGKSGAKYGQTRLVRVVRQAFGSVFHRLLFISFPVATAQTVLTTLYHFVPHLTRKSLIVNNKVEGWHPTLGAIR